MKILCEVVVTDIMPTLRSLITNDLMRTYGLNQVQISERLGITQPAVSQYKRGLRGANVRKIEAHKLIMEMVRKLASEIATGKLSPMETHSEMGRISEVVAKENIFDSENVFPCPCLGEKK